MDITKEYEKIYSEENVKKEKWEKKTLQIIREFFLISRRLRTGSALIAAQINCCNFVDILNFCIKLYKDILQTTRIQEMLKKSIFLLDKVDKHFFLFPRFVNSFSELKYTH